MEVNVLKIKKIITSILITVLVFLCFSTSKVYASIFDHGDKDEESDIEKIIDEDERWSI